MSFIKLSNDYLMESFTLVDNLFINEYMPYADEKQIKVYIYGLYLSYSDSQENTLENLCGVLNMEADEIVNVFAFWEDAGLVQLISKHPLEVKYLSMKRAMQPVKKYKAEKYYDFNKELQLLFPTRMLTPNEFNEYYLAMDTFKTNQDAMLMIVQYCINLKGTSVRYPYVLTVAKAWASEGVLTVEDVEKKLSEYEQQDETMRAVMRALGRKGTADLEEKQMLLKWTRSWGFDADCIVFAAKQCKGKGFKRLDSALDDYYRLSLFTAREMETYETRRAELRELAIKINRTIGVYYESLDHMIEHYVSPWMQKGFDEDALLTIAHYCFVSGIRNLEGINSAINRFFKLGYLTKESINHFIDVQTRVDTDIKQVLEAAGLTRNIIAQDRSNYRVWTADWGFSLELVICAAKRAQGAPYPMSAINKTLSYWRAQHVETLEAAENSVATSGSAATPPQPAFSTRNYSSQEIAAAFSDIDNFDDIGDI